MIKHIKNLWIHINVERRLQLFFLFILMIVAALSEVISIGAIIPFLSVFSNPDIIFENSNLQFLIKILNINKSEELLFPFTIIFIVTVFISAFFRFLLLLVQTKLGFAIGADFSFKMYKNVLYQPYSFHVSKNSSEVIAGIVTKANDTTSQILMPILILLSSSIMLIMILMGLILINPSLFISSFFGLGLIYFLIMSFTKKKIANDSKTISEETIQVVKLLQEGLGGIRDVLIDGVQDLYTKSFRKSDIPLREAKASITIIGGSPRYGVEALGISFIAFMTYYITLSSGSLTTSILPMLGALAMGAQRMLPVVQLTYSNWILVNGGRQPLIDTLEILNMPVSSFIFDHDVNPISFKKHIKLKNLSFRYGPQLPYILDDLSFKIDKGSTIGIIGETGSGKSTILDIFMGLLVSEKPSIFIDDIPINEENIRSWQKHITHVPQSIFLSDASIAENIAFGVKKSDIDYDLLQECCEKAQLSKTINMLKNGIYSLVGERGIMLSGGQRQRIGIARALYKKANVIIFDEATSALDNDTENSIMESIENLGNELTIIIVAHRLTTLKSCDQIIELSQGKINNIISYNELIKTV
jgi:ATP-binding cassette, subfamily B, bacterial PglK